MTHVHPTRDDRVVRALSEVVGGPVGDRAGRGRPFGALGVLLFLTALTFALGLVSKASCAGDDWTTTGQSRFTHLCVSEVPDAYTATGLVELAWPWSADDQTRLRYEVTEEPAAVGLWSYATAVVTHVLAGSPDLEARYDEPAGTLAATPEVAGERDLFTAVNAVGLALLAMLVTAAVAATRRSRPWDAAAFACAPVLALTGVVAWDLLPVAAAAGALWAWSRGRPAVGGLLVGVGAASGVWPALLLVALGIVAVRERRTTWLLPATVSAAFAWAVLNAPAFVTGRSQWEHFWSSATGRTADQGSLWRVLDDTIGLSDGAVTTGAWTMIGIWTAGVAALVLLAPGRPTVSQTALLLVAGVLVLGVAYEPQQALWLLPLAALARPRWRDLLVWQAGETFYFALSWWWQGGLLSSSSTGDDDGGFYWLAIVVRVAATLWLVGVVVRDVWWPESFDTVPPGGADRREDQVITTSSKLVAV